MQTIFNTLFALAIVGLAIWVFVLSRTVNKLKPLIPVATIPATTPERDSVSGGELWDALQSKVNEMTVDLKFNNNQ